MTAQTIVNIAIIIVSITFYAFLSHCVIQRVKDLRQLKQETWEHRQYALKLAERFFYFKYKLDQVENEIKKLKELHDSYDPEAVVQWRKDFEEWAERWQIWTDSYENENKRVMSYRVNLIKGRYGQTVYAVEELNEQNEWTTIKVFTNRKAAEDERQTLEAYGKKK